MTDWNNKEEVLEAVREDGDALQYASEDLKADKEVVLAAVNNWGSALQYASKELRADREVVLVALSTDELIIGGDSWGLDKEWVLVENNRGSALEYASEELKNDPEFMKEVEQYLTD